MKAVILLSTYNGAPYLETQLESLRLQSDPGWELWVRDDGSSDESVAILKRFADEDPRVRLLEDNDRRLGPAASFGRLLDAALRSPSATERAFFFCDQDDAWSPEKLRLMKARLAGTSQPTLAFSDLEVVDSKLFPISRSFQELARLKRREAEPLRLLVAQNYVTGCALAFNEALARLASPFPAEILMHDWWVALLAAADGELRELSQPLVRYRQHSRQATSGVRGRRWSRFVRALLDWTPLAQLMLGRFAQARAVERRLVECRPGARSLPWLREFLAAPGLPLFSALTRLRRLGVRMQTRPRTLVFFALFAALRKKLA